jgi:hypothetical protein
MADTIQEYLIALGYKIDEPGLAKFNLFLGTTSKSFGALARVVTATTTQIVESVTQIARQFEGLYYASQRTGETVAGLQAVGFAAKQIGISSEAARSAIENFARAVRMNPGVEGFLKGLGVGPGAPMERLEQFIKNTQNMAYPVRARMAGEILGIDEQTFRMLTLEGGLERFIQEEREHVKVQREAGVDAQRLAEKSTEYGRSINRLGREFAIFGEIMAGVFLPPLEKAINALDRLMQATNKTLGSTIKENKGLESFLAQTWVRLLNWTGAISDEELAELEEPLEKGGAAGAAKVTAQPNGGQVGGSNAASVMRYFQGKGYSPAAAAAIAANAQSESGYDPESFNPKGGGQGAFGLFQWRGDRLAGLRSRYGAHPNAGQQMDYAAWELQNSESATGRMLRGPMGNAATLGTMFSRDFERHGNAAEDAARGRLAERLVVQNSTTINVGAGSTAGATAQAVAGEQGRVNGDLVRNLQGAVR